MREKRGNLLDLLILLVIGFCIFSGVGRFLETRSQASVNASIAIVTLRIRGTDAYLPSAVTAGEGVFLSSGERFGSVEEISSSYARVTLESEGETVVGVWEDGSRWDAEVLLRVTGSAAEQVFLRDGRYAILSGQMLSLYTERAYLYGEVASVRILVGE